MSENLRRFASAAFMLDAVAQRVPNDAWDNPSCCEGWSAREVGGHAGRVITSIANLASGAEPPAAQPEAEVLGDDPAVGMRSIVQTMLLQLDQQGVLAAVVRTPFGKMPLDRWIGVLWVDPLTHAWDLADATGVAHGIDGETASTAHAIMQPISDGLRSAGMYAAPVEIWGGDPVSDFIAFTGRTPIGSPHGRV